MNQQMKQTPPGDRLVTALLVVVVLVVAGALVWPVVKPASDLPDATAERAGGRAPGGPGRSPGGDQPEARAVTVSPVSRGTVRSTVRITGDVVARDPVGLVSNVGGRISTPVPPVGTVITAGDRVVLVDPSRPGDAFSESPLISPVSGTVVAVGASQGDTITTQTSVVTLQDLSRLEIRTWVPERFLGFLRPGLRADVRFEAFPGELFPARVVRLAPVMDPVRRTLEVTLVLDRPDRRIRAGMFPSLELVLQERTGVLTVPPSALLETWQERYVYVVDDGNIARRRPVTTGLEGRSSLEVLEGLQEGDLLVVRGQSFLTEGMPVRRAETAGEERP
ncbi:RND family efflux transporter, MFP subunit [Alkalispirochaeta americana]|uniref:RND family efflux transporter, MFP subunit n=1 Tax=Alkalispirochaeta americana TaxID=159291 RepID=A0A1N6TN71_9SPIO|nr:efflux RND transporter periplasmic adaptor subunit [Alkalispirochaeta americana]SIQ54751.1 RND family efflux transporter, MFP subunit [Alkalispirochaeta americana]